MGGTYKIIQEVLDIIGFEADRKCFADELVENIRLKALVDLMNGLPVDKKLVLERELVIVGKNSEKVGKLIERHFSGEQVEQALIGATKEIISGWMKAISGTLTVEQKEKLWKLGERYALGE